MPGGVLTVSLVVLVVANLTLVLLLAPAALAGGFAGDPQRTALGMLLGSRLSAAEIVGSRFLSRLGQVVVVTFGGLPAIAFLGAYCGMTIDSLLALLLLLLAVACGSASLALLLSVLFNRARDALIASYVLGLALLIVPTLVSGRLSPTVATWAQALNPFLCVDKLVLAGQVAPAFQSVTIWSALALAGLTATIWLLWPTFLRRSDNRPQGLGRQAKVPRMGENPIRWKELYIESAREFGRLLRVLTGLILGLMLGGSILLTVLFLWRHVDSQPPQIVQQTLDAASQWIGVLALPLGWLIQWAVGVRAAAGISLEREQGTWDALMMSPLDGGEIVKAKMVASLYSLRWFLAATLIVWLLGVMVESIELHDFFLMAISTALYTCVMSAIGVWSSLTTQSSGRAITLTLLGWLMARIVFAIAATLLVGVSMLFILLATSLLNLIGGGGSVVAFPKVLSFEVGYLLFESTICLGTTFAIAWYCRHQFDRLAGRGHPRSKPVLVRPARRPTPANELP